MAAPEDAIQQALCPILVARDEELSILDAGLVAARRRQGHTYVLTGDAGIGKTRLAAGVRDRAQQSGMTCLWGGCSQAELALPYLPVLQALGGFLSSADQAAVVQRLGPFVQDLGRLFPSLARGEGKDVEGEAIDRKLRLFEGVLALLSIAASPGGCLLVLEDLHWADRATRGLIDYLVRRVAGTQVMLLLSCRSDELYRRHPLRPLVEEWRRRPEATIVEVRPLDAAGVAGMVQSIFQSAVLKQELPDLLLSRSSGNPFVIEEMLKDAINRGDIFRIGAEWNSKPITELGLPERVRDAIVTRLEQLPALQQELLRIAAVVGRPCGIELMSRILDKPNSEVGVALTDCVHQQLLVLDRSGSYRFRHALTREAIHDEMVPPEQRALHSRIAAVLATEPGSDAVEICHHLISAEAWREAVPLAMEVAQQATAMAASAAAVSLYERVLPHVTDMAQRVEIVSLLCQRLSDLLEWSRAKRYLEAEIPVLERSGEIAGATKLRLALAQAYGMSGRRDLRFIELKRVLEVLETQGPSSNLAEAYEFLAVDYLLDYRNREGYEAAKRAVDVATQVGDQVNLAGAYHSLGCHLWELGDRELGIHYFDTAIEMALAMRQFGSAAAAIGNEIEAFLWDFRFARAVQRVEQWKTSIPETARARSHLREAMVDWRSGLLERAVAGYEAHIRKYLERGGVTTAVEAQFYLAIALAELGRLDDSRAIVDQTRPLTNEHRVVQAWVRMRVGLDSGKLDDALGAASILQDALEWPLRQRRWLAEIAVEVLLAAGETVKSREVAATIDPEPTDPYQMRMEGRLALGAGDIRRAREYLAAAVDFWSGIGGRVEEARSRRLLGQALRRLGDRAGATEELRRAFTTAVRCGAGIEVRLTRDELARLGEPTEPTPKSVKGALESLHEPAALGGSSLLATMTLSREVNPTQLREILEAAIRNLARSPAGEESDAGKVLLDCYVNRVGTHEMVAEKLHLSRRTFYRRLDRGLAILASQLAAIGMPAN